MNYTGRQIVFREIPDEVSLSYLISGCQLRCPGCHSVDSWDQKAGTLLNAQELMKDLEKFQDWITCVLFMGGEWHQQELMTLLQLVQSRGLKTALYTGLSEVSEQLLQYLDYIKVGPYLQERGGLDQINTNQRLIETKSGRVLNSLFHHHKEDLRDSPQ